MITCFLSNISAKYYKNPSMLSLVIAKNVGDVFLRHSVVAGIQLVTSCSIDTESDCTHSND